ncbi:MAG: hypothetical protein R3E01_34590 [Pirellulaceae bacterium]|nr:hypothetical protein [Planctomycetales bacterium]
MRTRACIILCTVHLLALAVCTFIAAIKIESILLTGVICSLTGIAAGITAVRCHRYWLAAAGLVTVVLAVSLFILEAVFLNLGPGRAALPFCIVFVIHEAIVSIVILAKLNMMLVGNAQSGRQITLRTIFVAITSFAVFFAVARSLVAQGLSPMMAIALGMLGFTCVGLAVVFHSASRARAQWMSEDVPEVVSADLSEPLGGSPFRSE